MKTNNHCKSVHTPLGEQTSLDSLSAVLGGLLMEHQQISIKSLWGARRSTQRRLPQAQRASSAILWGKDSECFLTNCSTTWV